MKRAEFLNMLIAVILAGGLSRRFGRDKLLVEVNNTNVITKVAKAVHGVADKVLISVRDEAKGQLLMEKLGDLCQGIVTDLEDIEFSGPLRGMLSCISKIGPGDVLFVPGDMPWLDAGALASFFEACKSCGATSGSIIWDNGLVEVLIQYHSKDARVGKNLKVCKARGSIARVSDMLRTSEKACYVPAGNLTDNPLVFSNINTIEDLKNPKPRGRLIKGEAIVIESEYFWKAFEFWMHNDFAPAAEIYELEGDVNASLGVHHIALHAYIDAAMCLGSMHKNELEKKITEEKLTLMKSYAGYTNESFTSTRNEV
ncbi:MAG: molybdenum cofactor guanylyltransferase [Nitrososphaerota archaeon]